MKSFAFVLSVLALLSAAFAATYSTEYVADGWLQVTRAAEVRDSGQCFGDGVSNVCANTGAIQPNGGTASTLTTFTITARNIGTVDRQGIEVTESLSHVPQGAKIFFSPAPSEYDGRQATWGMGGLKAGESASVSYSLSAQVSEGAIGRIPDVSLRSAPTEISLSAPTASKAGDRITIIAKTASGQPVSDTVFYIALADGTRKAVKTNSAGTASFTADKEGFYTYSAYGYAITNLASTEVKPSAAVPSVAAAAVADSGITGSVLDVLPILAAVFAVAVIALIVYNFVAGRREEDEGAQQAAPMQPVSQQPSAPATYSQKFSFADEAKQEKKMRDLSHDLLASRKKHLRESVEKEGGEQTVAGEGSEKSVEYDDVDSELAALGERAAKEGEQAEEESEIEKTIAELEAIREKLRARKEAREEGAEGNKVKASGTESDSSDEEISDDAADDAPEEEASEEIPDEVMEQEEPSPKRRIFPKITPLPRKPVYEKRSAPAAKAKPSKKGVRLRFGNRGVKKK